MVSNALRCIVTFAVVVPASGRCAAIRAAAYGVLRILITYLAKITAECHSFQEKILYLHSVSVVRFMSLHGLSRMIGKWKTFYCIKT